MAPRRKSKRTAQPEADHEAEPGNDDNASQTSERHSPGPSKFNLGNMPPDISSAMLANLIPDVSFESPTAETIISCYRVLIAQNEQLDANTREVEELRAEIDRKDVELDQALQDRESAVKDLETSLEAVQNELKEVKLERNELASSRMTLQLQLSNLNSSQSTSSHELESSRRRVEETEREKRDLIGVISRLKDDASQRQEEIQALRDNLKKARKDHQELEADVRELRSAETSTKFKLETLSQQLQLARDENERTADELSSKVEDISKCRREKHTEVAQLQASLDSLTQTHNQILSSFRSLQSSHSTQTHQLSQALQKVQDLTGQLADQEAKYSSEAANLRRLVQMMEEREAQAKFIVEGIEKDWEGLGARAAAREEELRDELEDERHKVEALEKQLEDTRLVMDKINRGELPLPPAADRSGLSGNDPSSHGLMSLSPGLAMISRMQKSGKTFTEVYADYVRLQEELAKKNIEYERMDRTLAEVLAQIEERAPILAEQRRDYERVQAESMQLASQLTQALSERDGYAIHIQELTQIHSKREKENALLQQQLADLGRQIQTLLREIGRRDDATFPEDEEFVSIAPAENIDGVITNNLVLFRSIPALQEQNQKLLMITRDLGARMEAEERDYKETLDQQQREAVREAHEAIQALQAQLVNQQKSHHATIQAFAKERDTLKIMLARYKQNNGDTSVPHVNGHTASEAPPSLQQELQESHSNFDAYRHEIGIDTIKLREELMNYQREASQLGASLAKANAKIEFLNDRQRMAQEQYTIQAREYDNLSKRNQQLYDQYTRLDIACNHANDELSVANGHIERSRNECANLRAEKKIWESVQVRLVDENKTLVLERSRLSDLMANIQKMHNDIERSSESDRRRMETQVQTLESQAQELRTQVSLERDTVRQTTLQKDIEIHELRSRIDRLSDDLAKTRESLVGSETSQKHLQERVADLVKQVQTNEEKLAVYEHRASGVNGVALGSLGDGLNKERQLESDVAELRGALKAAEIDLATARSHVQQYQEISQASEAALATLSATHDEYKSSAEAQITMHESQEQALKEKLDSVHQDIARLIEKNSELQQTLEKERVAFASDKKMLEDIIVERTNSEMHSRDDQVSREIEVRQQEERAKTAEDKYSREVLAHAETIKAIETLKQELKAVQASARESNTAAETAQAKLTTSEESWRRQKDSLDKETFDLNTRCKDLATQNALLHQHLESVSSQASRIRQAADHAATGDSTAEGQDAGDDNGKFAELRSVVAYLRKEKEIVDLQLELSKQENARVKAQVDHLTQSLAETRNALSSERERAVESLEQSSQHAELLERINQLNILRESNSTLRAESEANARRARQLENQLSQLSSELDPLKEEARTARAELEEKGRQLSRLEDENRQWKERNTQLLTKYDRIDPSDVQALRDEIEDLQIDIRKYEEAQATHLKDAETQAKLLENTSSTLADFRSKYQSLSQESRTRLGALNNQMGRLNEIVADLRKQVKELTTERDHLRNQTIAPSLEDSASIEDLKSQIEVLAREKAAVEQLFSEKMKATERVEPDPAMVALQEERDRLLAERELWTSSHPAEPTSTGSATSEKAKQQIAELQKARDEAIERAKVAEDRVAGISDEIKSIRLQKDKFQARIAENEKRRTVEAERLEALTTKLTQEQEEAVATATANLRAEMQSSVPNPDELRTRHAEELQLLEARLLTRHEAELREAVENAKKEASSVNGIPSKEQKEKESKAVEESIRAATERGRMEAATKLKLKDSLLTKAQNNVKQLEAQIKAWREAGLIPAEGSTSSGPAIAKSTSGSNSAAAPTGSVQATPSAGPSLPRKPSISAFASTTDTATPGAAVGTRPPRQLARRSVGPRAANRGAAHAGAAVPHVPSATSGGPAPGMSIMGAAGKRTREESEATGSLAKRIKPAEGSGKPVALRRDRIPPPDPAPPT